MYDSLKDKKVDDELLKQEQGLKMNTNDNFSNMLDRVVNDNVSINEYKKDKEELSLFIKSKLFEFSNKYDVEVNIISNHTVVKDISE